MSPGPHNPSVPYRVPFGPGCAGSRARPSAGHDDVREELLGRLVHYRKQVAGIDAKLRACGWSSRSRPSSPQASASIRPCDRGQLGEVGRFPRPPVDAYDGLTTRVRQSGGHCRHAAITREGSPWLRWILTEAAMMIVKQDGGCELLRAGASANAKFAQWRWRGSWRRSAGRGCPWHRRRRACRRERISGRLVAPGEGGPPGLAATPLPIPPPPQSPLTPARWSCRRHEWVLSYVMTSRSGSGSWGRSAEKPPGRDGGSHLALSRSAPEQRSSDGKSTGKKPESQA